MNCGHVDKPQMITLCSKHFKTRKAAAKRVAKAEALLFLAGELLEKAQVQISVVIDGLNQNHFKIGAIREKIKAQMYDLERRRESGFLDLDETAAAALLTKKKLKRKRA